MFWSTHNDVRTMRRGRGEEDQWRRIGRGERATGKKIEVKMRRREQIKGQIKGRGCGDRFEGKMRTVMSETKQMLVCKTSQLAQSVGSR